jgi:hypothetical protein
MALTNLPRYSTNWGVLAFLLLYVFTPTIVGGFYATLAAIMLLSSIYLLQKTNESVTFNGTFVAPGMILALLALTMLSASISMSMSGEPLTPIRFSEIIKPVIFMIILMYAANVNLEYSAQEIKKTLVLAAKMIIIGQLIVVIDQLLNIDFFAHFYDFGKESGTEELLTFLRSTGTLGNPNYFAWVILQCGILIQAFSREANRYYWLLLVLFMILLSGSKSIVVAFPLSMLLVTWLKGERVIFNRHNFYWLLFSIALGFGIYGFVIYFPDVFPRLKILIALLTGEDTSGGGRYEIWERAYAYFLIKEEGVLSWMFGLGPIEMFRTLDNGYLYVFFRYGIFGLALHISILLYFIVRFYNYKDHELGALVVQYVLVGMLIEAQAEALAGWQLPILLYFYAGLGISYLYRKI